MDLEHKVALITGSAKRVGQTMLYLLQAGDYVTAEIIHVDGAGIW